MFDKWETGAGVTIKRNPNYWDIAHTPNYPSKIILKTIQDNSAALVSAKNKEIDAMYVIPPTDFYKNLENPDQFALVKAKPSEPAYTYIGYNELNPLFQDKCQDGASLLVDRKTIIDKFYMVMQFLYSHIYFYKTSSITRPSNNRI
jgi:oligopeptide transport system substrate-binding protein